MLSLALRSAALSALVTGCSQGPLASIWMMDAIQIQHERSERLCNFWSSLPDGDRARLPVISNEIARRGIVCRADGAVIVEGLAPEPEAPSAQRQATSDVNMRAGPGTGHRIIGLLQEGQSVTVLGQEDGWCECMTDSGQRVFIACRYLEAPALGWASLGQVPASGDDQLSRFDVATCVTRLTRENDPHFRVSAREANAQCAEIDRRISELSAAILGTWQRRSDNGFVETIEFRRDGQAIATTYSSRTRRTQTETRPWAFVNPYNTVGSEALEFYPYLVGVEFSGDNMEIGHQPGSSQNAWVDRWTRVTRASSTAGAARTGDIPDYQTVVLANARVRSGPGTSYGVAFTVSTGESVYVAGVQGDWCLINSAEGLFIHCPLLRAPPNGWRVGVNVDASCWPNCGD